MFNPTAELAMQTRKAKAEIETHPVTTKANISNYLMCLKVPHTVLRFLLMK